MAYACEIRNAFGLRGINSYGGNLLRISVDNSRLHLQTSVTSLSTSYSFTEELETVIANITGHTGVTSISAVLDATFYAGDMVVGRGNVPTETDEPITDVVFENERIIYSHVVDGFTVRSQLNLPEFRTYGEFITILAEAGGEPLVNASVGFLIFPADIEIACLDTSSLEDTTITLDINSIPPTLTVVDGDPGDIYITINAEDGAINPFTELDPFYQDRVRGTVERVLLETDGVDIRTWALQSDFLHVSLETMDLNELVEILTHVASVGRD